MASTTSTNEIFGQIGAAKIFTGSIAGALGNGEVQNQAQIDEIQEQIDDANASGNSQLAKKLEKKKKRLQKSNKLMSKVGKVVQGATDLLTKLAEFVDIGKKALINWLASVLVKIVPALEVAVKAILLTNIKKMVSCSLDPRIPEMWRTSGVTINEKEIDPRHILRDSPYSQYGRQQYFGIYEDDNDLTGEALHFQSRATDMNAFIWYVKNCSKYVSPFVIDKGAVGASALTDYFSCDESATLYNTHTLKSDGKHWFLPGCTFKQSANSNTIFLCVDRSGEDPKTCTYTIVPCSENLQGDNSAVVTGCNWYKNRRNYNKAKPLFKLNYSNDYNSSADFPKNNFKFQILPEPFKVGGGFVTDLAQNAQAVEGLLENKVQSYFGDEVNSGVIAAQSMTWPNITSLVPHYAKFNEKGVYSKSGRYSIDEHSFLVQTQATGFKTTIVYALLAKSDTKKTPEAYLIYNKKTHQFALSGVIPSSDGEMGTAVSTTKAAKYLVECYTGKTVYEFNYDYIMSFRLFDAKVIAANMVKALLNLSYPNPFDWLRRQLSSSDDDSVTESSSDADQLYYDNYIDSMIQSIIEEDDEEFTDCFYTFSNEDYVAMEEKTIQQVANGTLQTSYNEDITSVYNMLDAYSADATLNEQTEILTNVFTKVSNIMDSQASGGSSSGGNNGSYGDSDSSDSDSSFSNFLTKAIKFLISSIVNSILTPKVLLLIMINKKLMGNDPMSLDKNYSFDAKDVLNSMKGILSSMIKEVIDTIQKELLRIIMKYIAMILSSYIQQLAKEYARKWVDLLRQLLECFKFNHSSLDGGSNSSYGDNVTSAISSALDQIDGADIDTLAEQLIPQTNNC